MIHRDGRWDGCSRAKKQQTCLLRNRLGTLHLGGQVGVWSSHRTGRGFIAPQLGGLHLDLRNRMGKLESGVNRSRDGTLSVVESGLYQVQLLCRLLGAGRIGGAAVP